MSLSLSMSSTKLTAYGYKRMGFILDRGYFSRENIRCLDEKKCPFVMMVKGCKQLVSSIIKEHRHRFESKRDCFISAYHVYGTSVKAAIPGMEKEHQRYFHLYYSTGKAAGEREKLENLLEKMKQEIRKGRKTGPLRRKVRTLLRLPFRQK